MQDSEGMLSDTDYGEELCHVHSAKANELDFGFVAVTTQNACMQEIKAFVCGGVVGLLRLKRVLSNIFSAFDGCDQRQVLEQCGLFPFQGHDGRITFYLHLDAEGNAVLEPKKHFLSSNELQTAYESVSATWSSPSHPRSSSNS